MPDPLLLLGLLTLVIWLVLGLGWSQFWRIDHERVPSAPPEWPEVVAIIPARDEAECIEETLRSLWSQSYPGRLRIVLVDDNSQDGTAAAACQAAARVGREGSLTVVSGQPLPPGWTGKVWAMQQGLVHAGIPGVGPSRGSEPAVIPAGQLTGYVLFSDADIVHGRDAVRELVCRAEADACDLVSLMVRLRCDTAAERLMIPAFVFFFKLLYPFRKVNDPRQALAGAAGGTMLVRRAALARIGGLECIRRELIDDCSLAREIKRGGHRIWLGMSESSTSSRGYGTLGEVQRMIARTAYTQLGYSPLILVGCVAGLGLAFLAPPLLTFMAGGAPALLGGLAWLIMSGLYLPMVRFYRQWPLWAALLPLTAALYLAATVMSAWRHHCGRGGQWKGRAQSASLR